MLSPRSVRYGGLIGSLLLALAGHLGGVRSPWQPNIHVLDLLRGEHGVLMPLAWLAGTGLLIGAWWAGRHVVPSTRWAYVTAGLWLLPMLAPVVLASRDVYSYACQGAVVNAGHNPYEAGSGGFTCPWIEATAPIWRDSPAPYGPFFVELAGGAAALGGGSLITTLAVLRLIAVLGVLLSAVCLPILARRAGVPAGRAVWWVLASPLVAVHLVSGAHNDAVMIGLVLAGLAVLSSARGRPGLFVAGGALLGLAMSVKATAFVVVPFGALIALGGVFSVRLLLTRGGAVVGGAAGALLAVSAASGLGFGWVRGLTHSGDSVQWTSPSTAVGLTVNYLARLAGGHLNVVPVTRAIGLAVLAVLLVVLWWRARHGDPLLGAGLALAATVALSPVFHPWYATWPLAVLAVALPHAWARWLLIPCAVAAALVLPDGTSLALDTRLPGALAMTALVIGVAVLVVRRHRSSRPAQAGPEKSRPEQETVL